MPTYYGHPRLDYDPPASKLELYQEHAAHYGTRFTSASPKIALRIGGAITKHPLDSVIAGILVQKLREFGADARAIPEFPMHTASERAFVYLAGCSLFVRWERSTVNGTKTIKPGISRAKRMVMASRTPIAMLVAKQRERIAQLDQRIGRLMSKRVDEEETLADLIAMERQL